MQNEVYKFKNYRTLRVPGRAEDVRPFQRRSMYK